LAHRRPAARRGGGLRPADRGLRERCSPFARRQRDAPGAAFRPVLPIADRIKAAATYVQTVNRDTVKNCAFNILRFAVLCTKHPGFHEEREWRIVATPTMHPSPLVKSEVEVVRG